MPDFDTSVPHSARVYNYWLGGKDNFAADREAAERALEAYPGLVFGARANRAFLGRAVRYLVTEAGIRQFLDIGTGIPTASNTHEVAQQVEPTCRIVYVDNDPVVLSHARALLTSAPQGACAYLEADLRAPDAILAAAAQTLDFAQPVAVMLLSVLHLVPDDAQAAQIVARLVAECAPGSFLAISHPASDIDAEQTAEATRRLNQAQVAAAKMRGKPEVARLFSELELVPPGLVRVPQWRPRSELEARSPGALWAGVALKP
jgi:O-methyltransferase involved in polyketide biosynthesis